MDSAKCFVWAYRGPARPLAAPSWEFTNGSRRPAWISGLAAAGTTGRQPRVVSENQIQRWSTTKTQAGLQPTEPQISLRPRAFHLPLFVMTSRGRPEAPTEARIAGRKVTASSKTFQGISKATACTSGSKRLTGKSDWWSFRDDVTKAFLSLTHSRSPEIRENAAHTKHHSPGRKDRRHAHRGRSTHPELRSQLWRGK